jgi:hypothetical protein
VGPGVTNFSLATYQPVAFHAYPELMRARRAVPPASAEPAPSPAAPQAGSSPSTDQVGVTVLGICASPLVRDGLAAFLDGAGRRRDVRVSVGVTGAPGVVWVLREAVPYDVRALPQYPPDGMAAAYGSALPVAPPDAEPEGHRLLVVVWGTEPHSITWTGPQRPNLVVHCLDWVVEPAQLQMLAAPGAQVVLSRTVPAARPSLLGHCGRLLTSWAAFTDVPRGLVVTSLDQARGTTPLNPRRA